MSSTSTNTPIYGHQVTPGGNVMTNGGLAPTIGGMVHTASGFKPVFNRSR